MQHNRRKREKKDWRSAWESLQGESVSHISYCRWRSPALFGMLQLSVVSQRAAWEHWPCWAAPVTVPFEARGTYQTASSAHCTHSSAFPGPSAQPTHEPFPKNTQTHAQLGPHSHTDTPIRGDKTKKKKHDNSNACSQASKLPGQGCYSIKGLRRRLSELVS